MAAPMNRIVEQQLEDLAIRWLKETGWSHVHGASIAPDGARPERQTWRDVLLRGRLLSALGRINPHLPEAALEQAASAKR
jgi:type I restriction enzyme R subunit